MDWRHQAACRDEDPELFFPVGNTGPAITQIEEAKKVCMRCTVKDVLTVLSELRTGKQYTGSHHAEFPMRREQAEAVNKTYAYFQSIWNEKKGAVPRFLWNAKMRFGKTFTTYQLAKKLETKRVLVVTFKPAVEDAWQTDLESHVDFDGWQYLSRNSDIDPTKIDRKKPVVYFGSFQDLLGRDDAGNIKPRHEWLRKEKWDLVVFDEYHFGAWRDTAKELFEGEDEAVARKEANLEYATNLDKMNEDLGVLSEKETEFLPITTKAYLYLSGTPFKALSTGEFIEEQQPDGSWLIHILTDVSGAVSGQLQLDGPLSASGALGTSRLALVLNGVACDGSLRTGERGRLSATCTTTSGR